jgi:hypothetical protein
MSLWLGEALGHQWRANEDTTGGGSQRERVCEGVQASVDPEKGGNILKASSRSLLGQHKLWHRGGALLDLDGARHHSLATPASSPRALACS